MLEMLINLLKDLLYLILVGAVPIVVKYIVSFMEAKKTQVEVATENSVFNDTVSDAMSLIIKAVNTVSQTYVEGLKKEGKFTEEAQKKAFDDAFNTAKTLISVESQELLSTVYSDVDAWIRIQIESYILESKKK